MSNSINLNQNKISEEIKDKTDDIQHKSNLIKKKEMITYKNIQNIDITTYNSFFSGCHFSEGNARDFCSFIQYLNEIKSKYNPSLMKNRISENFENENKFSLTHDNITKLISFHKKRDKNIEISYNTRYIKAFNLDDKNDNYDNYDNYVNYYATKSLIKGKHCFEIEILNMEKPNLFIGLIDISFIDLIREAIIKKISSYNIKLFKMLDVEKKINIYEISETFLIQKNDKKYNHYTSYGDILGCCFDLDKKLFYLFLNGEIINAFPLNVDLFSNKSVLPIIGVGNCTEIIFNPGHNLEYMKAYEELGFVPLDEKGKNNYEISKLREVTEQFINILKNNGTMINSRQISYSDINQIYHIIFDFFANVSLKHSYIIQNSFFEQYLNISNELDVKDFELWYLILKFILNMTKNKKLIIKNIFLNLSEAIHIYLRKGKSSTIQIQNLLKLFIYLFKKKKIINILSKMTKILIKIFRSIFVSFHFYDSNLEKNNLDFIINQNNNDNSNNSDNSYFPNIIISKEEFLKLNKNNFITNSKEIY